MKVGILARAGSRVKAKTGERRGRPKQNPGSGRNRGNQGHIVVKVHGNCKPPEKPLFSPHFAAVTRQNPSFFSVFPDPPESRMGQAAIARHGAGVA
ncbi:hypothetical protein [Achromobacter aegrifaciens]|uniref:hypothetical protein n=1 Tax=Achromobacter aegrifaciens TaxID=1287736 RepID=UPI00158438FB|nr:hypothetical protein [Achromobacter aegrifaciens]